MMLHVRIVTDIYYKNVYILNVKNLSILDTSYKNNIKNEEKISFNLKTFF
ncbi:hypothetical protein GJT97_00465 [Enterobacteriaceae endosymbiont of Donacia proxima]|nr:hypothetical protein [Enterobacteriaceae endosymbiont of Donacia proxima]QJC35180.1 hypothetical protein GJT97_00465 [Enterobacteriaceae endosymbiont of Donacia proxima]